MRPTTKLKLFSWLQEESLLPVFNSFDDPISCLNLESKFNDFSNHSDNLELVLEQAIPKAFQKLAVQHATAALDEENLSEAMDLLDKMGTNPFRYFTAYESVNHLVNELPYRPEVVGVVDVDSRLLQYGRWGRTFKDL
jgi:hypothetical protein